MIRRWFRALARTGPLVRPSPVSSPAGRRGRTVLRLEAVEDRTLASVTPGELPLPTESDVAVTSVPDGPAPTDEQSPPANNGPLVVPTDGWNTGWVTPATNATDGRSTIRATVLKTEGGNLFTLDEPASASGRRGSDLDQKSTSKREQANGSGRAADAGTALATTVDGAKPIARTAGQSPPDRAAAPVARTATEDPPSSTAVATDASQTGRRVSRNGEARSVADDAGPTGARLNRDGRGPRTASVAAPRAAIPAPDLSDGALLHRFVAHREQSAFTALVQRHGPLVLGVCQRVLGDYHAAQDASQATFVVLARKAGILDRTSPLGGWLYKVAYHLALRTRAVAAKQRLGEREAAFEETGSPAPADNTLDQQELHQVLREELQGLPEKYRAPLALVYIDGRSHADAAQAIGVPRGSMAKRVGEGLDRLRERLEVRGLGL